MSIIAKSLNVQKRINAAEKRVNDQHMRNAEKFESDYHAFEIGLRKTKPDKLVMGADGKLKRVKQLGPKCKEPTPQVLFKLKPGQVPSVMQQHMKRSRKVSDEELEVSHKRRLLQRGDLQDGA